MCILFKNITKILPIIRLEFHSNKNFFSSTGGGNCKNSLNINYFKFKKTVSLKVQYEEILAGIISKKIILGRQYSVEIGNFLNQLLSVINKLGTQLNKNRIITYRKNLINSVNLLLKGNIISLKHKNVIFLSLKKLENEFKSVDWSKKPNKNQLSPNQEVQNILFQMILLSLNVLLLVYSKNSCPLLKMVDNLNLDLLKLSPPTLELIKKGAVCNSEFTNHRFLVLNGRKNIVLKYKSKEFYEKRLNSLTEKQKPRYIKYLKELEFEQSILVPKK